MSDTSFLRDLSNQIDQFEPGDLIFAMEIKEFIDTEKNNYSDDSRELLLDLSTLFHGYILEGENDELNVKFLELKNDLNTLETKKISMGSVSSSVLIEDSEVLRSFIQESHDHLDTIEDRILTLENKADPDLIDDIFRSMHTIKGVSSFLGLNNIQNLSHSLESLLDRLRISELDINSEIISILLEGTDILVNMINFIEGEAEFKGEGKQTFSIAEPEINFDQLLSKIRKIGNPAENRDIKIKPMESVVQNMDDLITEDMVIKFIEESSDLLDSAEHCILELETSSETGDLIDHAFRNLHTIKGNSGFFGFVAIEENSMETENLLDLIRKGDNRADNRNISVILQKLDYIRNLMNQLLSPDDNNSQNEETYKPLGEVLVGMGVSKFDVEHAADLQNKKLGEILVEEGVVSNSTLDKALKSQKKAGTETPVINMKRKDIRIDMEKLDRLFDMVGELITAEAMVVDSEDIRGMELREFSKSALYLSKITREIQSITMSMRMIPLEGLFNKMKRLVRDLSRKMDKPVQFLISGADTEMDRNVIEEIADPLVHIIRNAIDHGLENPKDRKASRKNPVGVIDLNARYEGNEIWITVSDDGAGLKREKILNNAIDKGLLKGDPEDMEEKEIWKLIFEPGFSTVDKVSEISGRGVGMDVVRRNIEKLRGNIDINTVEGEGTDMILRIPLTLAIIDAISYKVSSMVMALQSSDVIEFLKPTEEMFTETKKGQIVINIRSEIIPVIDMIQFYNLKNKRKNSDQGVMIVISAGGKKAALVVDEILGSKQMVVKALPELLDETRAVSGCSLMGNGEVCLIMDAAALIRDTLE